jgi:hypothetical protein
MICECPFYVSAFPFDQTITFLPSMIHETYTLEVFPFAEWQLISTPGYAY